MRVKPPLLLAVPNVSEGRDARLLGALAKAVAPSDASPVRLLDVHSDRDHHRAVFTLAARQRALSDALLRLARVAVESIDVVARAGGDAAQAGAHPHVGALDVVPVVYLDHAPRAAPPAPRRSSSPTALPISSTFPCCSTASSRATGAAARALS